MCINNLLEQIKKGIEFFKETKGYDPDVILVKKGLWLKIENYILEPYNNISFNDAIMVRSKLIVQDLKIFGLKVIVIDETMNNEIKGNFFVASIIRSGILY